MEVAGSCEHSNEPSCSIKGRIFLDQLSNYQLIKIHSTPLVLIMVHAVTKIASSDKNRFGF
jgi:hypothetical protein